MTFLKDYRLDGAIASRMFSCKKIRHKISWSLGLQPGPRYEPHSSALSGLSCFATDDLPYDLRDLEMTLTFWRRH